MDNDPTTRPIPLLNPPGRWFATSDSFVEDYWRQVLDPALADIEVPS